MVILGKVKVLPNVDMKWISYRYALFWTISNLFSVIGALYELYMIAVDTAKLQAKKMIAAQRQNAETQEDSVEKIREKLGELEKKRFAETLLVIKFLGDSITST